MMALAEQLDMPGAPRVIAGKYRLENLLSEGGMGSVWRAFNLQLEVPVAIKLLRPGLSVDELGERLRIEARAAAKLVHPSIIRVFDIGESEAGEPFIVMELLNGQSLGDLLQQGALPAVNAVQLMLPIAEALSWAHARGVVHRDLKPDNIFLANEGDALQPKLLDFGIAKVTSAAVTGRGVLTQTGTLLGSPDYMAPEQAYGHADIDQRCDIWAFCVVLYEAIAGESPFSCNSVQNTLRRVVEDEPLPLDVLVGADPALADLIQQGLEKDREQRPSCIFELGQQLAAWLATQGIHEDATGASLESKWLGRHTDTLLVTSPRSAAGPLALHDQQTLVSVLNPQLSPEVVTTQTAPGRPPRRWVPSLMVAGAALLGCLGAVSGLELHAHADLREPRATATPRPAARVAEAVPVVPITALSLEAPEQPAPLAVAPKPTLASSLPAASKPRPRALPKPGAPALKPWPQTAALRDPADDLIAPY